MLCSPLTAIPVFLSLTEGKSGRERGRIALWMGVAIAAILLIASWIGGPLLSILGIRIPAFQCAGGVIVFLISLSMLNAKMSPMKQTESEEETRMAIPVVPLAIPVMAGPGALSAVIVLSSRYQTPSEMLILSLCNIAVGALVALVLYFATQLERKLGPSGMNIITRIGGLILASLAVEIFAQGIDGIFFQKS